MTLDERREELERIRNAPGGGHRIFVIYSAGPQLDDGILTPASFVEAMIDKILQREFPDGCDRRRVEVGDFVIADGVAGEVVSIDDAYCNGYVRLCDDKPGAGMRLVKIASLEIVDGPPV